jgi:hypothetical protein
MRSPLRILLLTLALLISLAIAAQQTKTKTKTESGKTKTKTATGKAETDAKQVTVDTMTMPVTGGGGGLSETAPYTAVYSSQFTIGNAEHSRMILDLWKDWDDNAIDRHSAWLADSIVMETSNGTTVRGKQNFISSGRQYRSQYSTVKSTLEAMMPLYSTDKNENWVAIWGLEHNTMADGRTTTNRLHEIWRINKEGKMDYVRQFTAKLPTQ